MQSPINKSPRGNDSDDSLNKFWSQKKKSNWFCNRPLSPLDENTDRTIVTTDNEKKINNIENCLLSSHEIIADMTNLQQKNGNDSVQENITFTSDTLQNQDFLGDNIKDMDKNSEKKMKKNCNELHSLMINKKYISDCDCIGEECEIVPPSSNEFFPASDDDSFDTPSKEEVLMQYTSPYFDNICESPNYSESRTEQVELSGHNTCSAGNISKCDINIQDDYAVMNINEHFLKNTKNDKHEILNIDKSTPKSIVENNKNAKEQTAFVPKSSQKVKRKPDFCYFCETEVLNFARHIKRNHPMEYEVLEIFSKPVQSKERKHLITLLRNKGNYLKNASESYKPVRQSYIPNKSVLPCDNCLGFYSSNLLYRHRKKCGNKRNGSAQIEGQCKLIGNIKTDQRLKEVFPRMRADKISLEAKKDAVICAFGARYIRIHREKHFINVTSRKMRELAKILLEIKKKEPSITNMLQALQPQYFDLFVEATKTIANYDPQKDIYRAPTFAMNIVTSLKQCCDIAITFVLKRKGQYATISAAEAEANLKTMIHLFTTNWRFEISSQAANDLNLNKWNKITIVPLASDLKLLKQYLINSAEDALKKLKSNKKDIGAYNNLLESIYCRVILLNRKRPGELQRMLLQTYLSAGNDKQNYEEFSHAITLTEQILLKKLKRVVIRGKRGRGVPVLFSTDIQDHIKMLLASRSNFVPEENLYLFGKANLTTPISGYKVLNKYAKMCGAKNPSAITSTRLRKHLATLTQIFNMNENEIEQLATFMGHTPGIHKNSYRLPDDIYQTAKISKLLFLMEKGTAGEYKGKSLDEIDIDMEDNLLKESLCSDESDIDEDINYESVINSTAKTPTSSKQSSVNEANFDITSSAVIPKRKIKRELIPWTRKQKEVVKKFFQNHIQNRRPPKRTECEQLIEKYPEVLSNKSWQKIKVFIQNEYTKNKKYKDK